MTHDGGPAAGRLGAAAAPLPRTPTRSCSATRTCRCTRSATASTSSTPARRPSAGARRRTRWAWRADGGRLAFELSSSALRRARERRSKVPRRWTSRSSSPAPPARCPSARRGLPALLLRAGGDRLLFDCGEGTQQQLLRSVGLPELDAVFLTHFHLDHWLGLLGMVKTFDLRARERPLTLYGPPGLRALIEAMRPVIGRTGYPLAARRARAARGGALRRLRRSPPSPSTTACTAYGYAFVEDDRPGPLRRRRGARARRRRGAGLRPPAARRDGRRRAARAGRRARPARAAGSSISGDTRPCQTTEVYAHGADVLVHEATFLEDERARARETAHSTAAQAAELARDAGVRLLALTHLSTRYFPRDVRDEARATFPATVVPRDFDAIDVPFPERGEPALVKAEREPAPATAPEARSRRRGGRRRHRDEAAARVERGAAVGAAPADHEPDGPPGGADDRARGSEAARDGGEDPAVVLDVAPREHVAGASARCSRRPRGPPCSATRRPRPARPGWCSRGLPPGVTARRRVTALRRRPLAAEPHAPRDRVRADRIAHRATLPPRAPSGELPGLRPSKSPFDGLLG